MEIKKYAALPEDAKRLRLHVFVDEQKFYEEIDETDERATHLLMYDGDKAVAVCRFFYSEEKGAYMIGRVAVLKEYRGQNLGRQLMLHAEQLIREQGGTQSAVSAQCRVSGFYESLGYEKRGEVYLDEYCPHILMVKDLGSRAEE